MSFLFDTNIIIDYINSVPQASAVFTTQSGRAVSIMSWIEVMAGATPTTKLAILSVLSTCTVVSLTPEIAERAAMLRQQTRLKLPDAIILATAQHENLTLVTRNTRVTSQSPGSTSTSPTLLSAKRTLTTARPTST